jgi:hypothetical protein
VKKEKRKNNGAPGKEEVVREWLTEQGLGNQRKEVGNHSFQAEGTR